MQVVHGIVPTAPDAPTRDGYKFYAWSLEEKAFDFETYIDPVDNVTLVAKWAALPQTITLDLRSGTADPDDTSGLTGLTGESLTVAILLESFTFTKTGYTIGGWTTEPTGTEPMNAFVVSAGGNTLYAIWTADAVTITYVTGDENVTEDAEATFTGAEIALPATERTGYILEGWYLENTFITRAADPYTVPDTGDHTLYAKWTPIEYFVTYAGGSDVIGTAPVDTGAYNIGNTVVLPGSGTLKKEGYTFLGWTSDAEGDKDLHGGCRIHHACG